MVSPLLSHTAFFPRLQALLYGQCLVGNMDTLTQNKCAKEFEQFQSCVRKAVRLFFVEFSSTRRSFSYSFVFSSCLRAFGFFTGCQRKGWSLIKLFRVEALLQTVCSCRITYTIRERISMSKFKFSFPFAIPISLIASPTRVVLACRIAKWLGAYQAFYFQ